MIKNLGFEEQRELTQYLHFYRVGPTRGENWCCRLKHQLCLAPDLSSSVVPVGHQIDERWLGDWIHGGIIKRLGGEHFVSLVPGHEEVSHRCHVCHIALNNIILPLNHRYSWICIRNRNTVRRFCQGKTSGYNININCEKSQCPRDWMREKMTEIWKEALLNSNGYLL